MTDVAGEEERMTYEKDKMGRWQCSSGEDATSVMCCGVGRTMRASSVRAELRTDMVLTPVDTPKP